jgi:hypothetical protein
MANAIPQTDVAKPLPADFRALVPFLPWALSKEEERTAKRRASTHEEILAFYNAMLSRIDAVTDYLKQFPLDGMPAEAETLFHLSLSLIEVSNAVELYKQPRLPLGFDPARFVPVE